MRLIRLLKEDIAREAADWVSNDIITTVQAEKICEQYGVEAFFASKETALALEEDLRDGGVAVLMIADDGRARIKNVIAMPSDGD